MLSVESMPEQELDLSSVEGEAETERNHRCQVLVQCAMQFECKQIECKLVSSLVVPNAIKQQSNKLGTRSGAKELVALSIVSVMQDHRAINKCLS
jgi:hypothetical protein